MDCDSVCISSFCIFEDLRIYKLPVIYMVRLFPLETGGEEIRRHWAHRE